MGQQNSTLLHVPVVPLVLASRARVVVGTGFPLLFHFSCHYYSPGCSHPGSSMRDIATLSAPQNPWGVDGQILTPWKLSHARRARHVPMPIGHSFAGLPPHSRRHNPQKWLVPLYRMTTCACGSGQQSPSPWPSCATHVVALQGFKRVPLDQNHDSFRWYLFYMSRCGGGQVINQSHRQRLLHQ